MEERTEDSAAAGETTAEEEKQKEEQKEASGAVPTCVLNKWYLKNKKIRSLVNHIIYYSKFHTNA